MNSKEFGLVAFQQVFQIQDLHYGFWEDDETPDISKFKKAQTNYTTFLCDHIEKMINADKSCKIIDIGCGIGITTNHLLEKGYRVDALVPSSWMANKVKKITKNHKNKGEVFECGFEDFPIANLSEKYSLAFFSESYQYINMQAAFDVFKSILEETGTVIIFDFFKKDNIPGKSPIGGGHSLSEFYKTVAKNDYQIHTDIDVTKNLSPNIKLVNDVLVERVIPFGQTLDAFLSQRHSILYGVIRFLFRKKLANIKFKYSSSRNAQSFEEYKTYRFIILKKKTP